MLNNICSIQNLLGCGDSFSTGCDLCGDCVLCIPCPGIIYSCHTCAYKYIYLLITTITYHYILCGGNSKCKEKAYSFGEIFCWANSSMLKLTRLWKIISAPLKVQSWFSRWTLNLSTMWSYNFIHKCRVCLMQHILALPLYLRLLRIHTFQIFRIATVETNGKR